MAARSPGAGIPDGELRRVLAGFDLGVVVRRVDLGLRQLPAYTRFFWPGERAAPVRWNVDFLLRWILGGAAPDEYLKSELHELLRARAVAGQPIDDSILVYRRGVRILWEALLDLASEAGRAVLTAQADTVWGYFEDYLDLIVAMFAQAYADQQDTPSTAGDRRARALFDRLCAPLPVTVEDQDRADRLGFDLGAPYCPFTAELAEASAAAQADLAARLRTARALAFTEGVRVTGLTGPEFDWTGFLTDPRLLLAQDPPTGRASLAAATESLRALLGIAAAAKRRGRVSADDFLPELLLASSPGLAGRLAAKVLGPLDRAETPDLARTLRCLAEHRFDNTATAAALPVHRNTLLYRIGRIEKLTGLSLRDSRDRMLVLLAVDWEDVSGSVRLTGRSPARCTNGTGDELRRRGGRTPWQATSGCCWLMSTAPWSPRTRS